MELNYSLLVGGLILFLYAISGLSETLQEIFSRKVEKLISGLTKNLFFSLLTGTIFTILLESSSAVIILTIIIINARKLTFKNAIGVIMGANIGTTVSSQLFALEIGDYAFYIMILGLIMKFFSKTELSKNRAQVIFFFGTLFFGLYLMQIAVEPLKNSTQFQEWMIALEDNYLKGALIGGLITLVIQSSSGTVGMAIILGKQGLLSTAIGISLMLGAELGTCSDTLLATIKGSRDAIRAGLFHLIFNFLSIVIGLVLFTPFLTLVEWVSISNDIGRQIANAHLLFNCLGVIVLLPFVHSLKKLLFFLVPNRKVG